MESQADGYFHTTVARVDEMACLRTYFREIRNAEGASRHRLKKISRKKFA